MGWAKLDLWKQTRKHQAWRSISNDDNKPGEISKRYKETSQLTFEDAIAEGSPLCQNVGLQPAKEKVNKSGDFSLLAIYAMAKSVSIVCGSWLNMDSCLELLNLLARRFKTFFDGNSELGKYSKMLRLDITECTRMSIPHYQSLQNNLLQNPENGGYIFSQFHRLKIHGAPVKTHTVADAERVMINANLESLAITGLGNEFHFQKHFCLTFPTPLPSLELNFESGTAVGLEEIFRPFLMGETGGILKRSLSLFVRNTETIKLANITLQVYDGSEKKMGGSGLVLSIPPNNLPSQRPSERFQKGLPQKKTSQPL